MTAELVRGQNHPLSQARLEIRVSAGKPIVAAATLSDEQGKVRDTERVAHPGTPTLPGLEVPRQAAAAHRLAVDLDAMPDTVHRVHVLLALPTGAGGPARFGAVAAPFVAVTGLDGTEVASYTITGLEAETAVVALELYRRQGVWKVRAVGQGYAGGLAELFADQGVPQAHQLAAAINDAVAQGMARSVAAPPPRTTDGDRTRQAAAPTRGQDHGGSPYGTQTPQGTTAGRTSYPGGSVPPDPSASADSSALTQPSVPAGGPIDYHHPRRRRAGPPRHARQHLPGTRARDRVRL
ncbi:TerD family protein, partial [Streptomyces sp. NPDC086077]|uniref:TerD family protein n=1 Tax=Streptomyces sp. NPDC086077 TaxID=3154862 RepID=UPI0034201FAE